MSTGAGMSAGVEECMDRAGLRMRILMRVDGSVVRWFDGSEGRALILSFEF